MVDSCVRIDRQDVTELPCGRLGLSFPEPLLDKTSVSNPKDRLVALRKRGLYDPRWVGAPFAGVLMGSVAGFIGGFVISVNKFLTSFVKEDSDQGGTVRHIGKGLRRIGETTFVAIVCTAAGGLTLLCCVEHCRCRWEYNRPQRPMRPTGRQPREDEPLEDHPLDNWPDRWRDSATAGDTFEELPPVRLNGERPRAVVVVEQPGGEMEVGYKRPRRGPQPG
ncbi:MAG: hypothetical protein M1833_005572 [Piccolia ochrophora]|nr:MAG: hypothetical protein M1833_005572 [Piccolia ochrophora]